MFEFSRPLIAKLMVLLTLLSLTVVYTIPWIFANALEKKYSGLDFHGYWYAGHYVRQGVNSYAAILNNPDPVYWDPRVPGSGNPYESTAPEYTLRLPIKYLDGVTVTKQPVAHTIIVATNMTPPLNLLVGLLSWFSWDTARLIWLALNLIIATAIPWLALRLMGKHQKYDGLDTLIFALVFYNFYGLRQSLIVGQETIVCLFLLVLALLFHDRWVLSGILLGFGISKYSVGLPVFLYFLLQRKYPSALVAVAVQTIGMLFLIPFKWGSPVDTITAFIKVFDLNNAPEGIHMLARFSDARMQTISVVVILVAVTYLMFQRYFYRDVTALEKNIASLNDLNIIVLGVFLITYHRIHNMPFMIFFLLPCLATWIERRNLAVGRLSSITLVLAVIVILTILIFPTVPGLMIARFSALQFIPSAWISKETFSSVSMLLMLALSAWLYRARLLESRPVEYTQQTA